MTTISLDKRRPPKCPACKGVILGIFKQGKLIGWNWKEHVCNKHITQVKPASDEWIAKNYPRGPAWTGD